MQSVTSQEANEVGCLVTAASCGTAAGSQALTLQLVQILSLNCCSLLRKPEGLAAELCGMVLV